MSGFRQYGEVLASAQVRAALGASIVGRVSLAMNGLALLLLTRHVTGSYAVAGLVAAANGVAFALFAPSRARLADRRGPAGVLRFTGVAHPLSFLLFVALALAGAPSALLVVASALIGATLPPLGSVMRAAWTRVIDERLLRAAYSLESTMVELCFVTGPLLVAVLVAVGHPAVALLASAVFVLVGTRALATVPFVRDMEGHPDRPSHVMGPLVSPVVRSLLLTMFTVGAGFGAAEVAVIAFVEQHGSSRSVAGVVLALWSFGSMAGGLTYGALHLRSHGARQLPVLGLLLGVAASLPMLAGGVVSLGLLMTAYGVAIAPLFACGSLVMGEAAPEGTVTEAFAWVSSMIFAGAAGGTALAGVVIEARDAETALGIASVSGLLTVLMVLGSLRGLSRLARAAEPISS